MRVPVYHLPNPPSSYYLEALGFSLFDFSLTRAVCQFRDGFYGRRDLDRVARIAEKMVGDDDDASSRGGPCPLPTTSTARKTFCRSASWSMPRSSPQAGSHFDHAKDCSDAAEKNSGTRRFPVPLTPRSQQNLKNRSCLPPLQPLAITKRSLDEWPKAGSDDVGEWPQPPTPSGKAESNRPGEGLKLDLSSFQRNPDAAGGQTLVKRDRIAFFDKECSKVADHIYLGGDVVARNRDILREHGITHVLNCVGFVCPEYFKADLVYKTLWLQDSPSEDITSILYDVFDYFEDVRQQGGRVLVHCCQGVSRSTSLVIAYLMWREGQSFDDAFQYVKAARGIANPNMGFACQLLQCQKRVHAIPLSPSSVLRMYRMTPHSPYDPLHLVPKMLNDPSPSALDSRGAFIVHVPAGIYVWIGKSCDPVMERDAKAAACQVVRYERVQGPVTPVAEGEEPSDFWDAFLTGPLPVDKEQVESALKAGAGKKKVESYDVDFELFHKAITGGFVPPFSQSAAGQETHLPARESNWSLLRRKLVLGSMKEWVTASRASLSRVYSDSALFVDANNGVNKSGQLTLVDSSSSPHFSPCSLSSELSSSSKSSSDSPSTSPSTSSSSLTPSSASSNLSHSLPPPSKSSQILLKGQDPISAFKASSKPFLKAVLLPAKGLALSLAQRRGCLSPLVKLPEKNVSPVSVVSPIDGFGLESETHTADINSFNPASDREQCLDSDPFEDEDVVEKTMLGYRFGKNAGDTLGPDKGDLVEAQGNVTEFHSKDLESPVLTTLGENGVRCSNLVRPVVYSWPVLEKIVEFSTVDLDSRAVFLFLAPDRGLGKMVRKLYLWIGNCFECCDSSQVDRSRKIGKKKQIDWNEVGSDVLTLMGLPKDIPIKSSTQYQNYLQNLSAIVKRHISECEKTKMVLLLYTKEAAIEVCHGELRFSPPGCVQRQLYKQQQPASHPPTHRLQISKKLNGFALFWKTCTTFRGARHFHVHIYVAFFSESRAMFVLCDPRFLSSHLVRDQASFLSSHFPAFLLADQSDLPNQPTWYDILNPILPGDLCALIHPSNSRL
ncbi:hypothetical protein ACLOJK_028099 [Asimina triloba]